MLRSNSKNSIDESKGEELQEGNNGSAIGDAIKVCHMRYQGMSHTLSRYVTYAIKVCHIRYQGMSHMLSRYVTYAIKVCHILIQQLQMGSLRKTKLEFDFPFLF